VRDQRTIRAAERRLKAIRRAFIVAVPESRVLIRRADGSAVQVALGRGRLVALGAAIFGCALWAAVSTLMLLHHPEELVQREQRLEEMLSATHSAQQRLLASQKMVADITREVDLVQSSLMVLAESNAALVKGAPEKNRPSPPLPVAEPVRPDDSAADAEVRAVRDQVRRLETSLERLRLAYAQAVQSTSDAAAARISDAEHSLARLGIDPGRVIESHRPEHGRGGPFVPINATATEPGLNGLLDRLDRWSGVKAAMLTMPLGDPIHAEYEVSSVFGRRNDPINRRTGIHEGVDLTAPFGTPVHATGEGQVLFAGPWDRYGLAVEIDHGGGVTTRYAHLSRILVREGQHVSRSTAIGLLGNTGRSTGPHLHYEVRLSEVPRDPLKFIASGDHVLKIW
jgi:murein DD-endopeptidase MepM/ murein hydrolase activator NlpD